MNMDTVLDIASELANALLPVYLVPLVISLGVAVLSAIVGVFRDIDEHLVADGDDVQISVGHEPYHDWSEHDPEPDPEPKPDRRFRCSWCKSVQDEDDCYCSQCGGPL